MKRRLLLMVSIALLSLNAFSQERAISENGWWDNWFIQLKGGASFMVAGDQNMKLRDKGGNVGDITTPYVGIAAGKFFSPSVGARVDIGGWSLKNFNPKTNVNGESLKANYIQTNFDAMFNMMNIFGHYNPDRIFDINMFVGVGYLRSLGIANEGDYSTSKNFLVPRAGAQFMFHITDRFDIFAETNFNMVNRNLLLASRKEPGYLNATVGVNFNLGKTGWKTGEFSDPAMIQSLNDRINEQRGQISEQEAEIAALNNKLKDCQRNNQMLKEQAESNKPCDELLEDIRIVVTYEIGKVHVSKGQLVQLYNVAKLMEKHPDMKICITSYADAKTGSAKRNQQLSEDRASVIKRIFTENYNIAEDRICTKAYGASEQAYDENDWNRVSIINIK